MKLLNLCLKRFPRFLSDAGICVSQTKLSMNSWHGQSYVSGNSYSKDSPPPTLQDIKSFLRAKNIKTFTGPTCFKCENIFPKPKAVGRPKKSEVTPLTLYINKTTGSFHCTATGRSGSWEELRKYLKTSPIAGEFDIPSRPSTGDNEKVQNFWNHSLPIGEMPDIAREEVLVKFGLDHLPLTDLELNGIRVGENGDCIIAPWFPNSNVIGNNRNTNKGNPLGVKVFLFEADDSKQFDVRQFPSSGYHGMLGMSQVPVNSKTIVLTMNEFDAIAVNCGSSQYKAASLPCGITYLPLEVLPYLEQFAKIILWFDNCQLSWEAARRFAKKLDERRCEIVRPTPGSPSPLQALSKNFNLDEIISSAVSAEIRNIVSFADLRGFVKDELTNCDTVCGVKWHRFPKLTEKLKGHRRGELTVFTGPTGSGKTTFMSEYSLDLAMQGVSTLWGSFEIQNVRLVATLMKQFVRSRLEKQMDNFEAVAERFQRLPMHFMTYNGPHTTKEVIHTMRQAAYVHDIQHIIIDNLQFMMGAMPKNSDRFMVQDMLIGEFRNFATSENIHVTVVIHPRKEDAGVPLQISSIFGTAKATQEADNVLILQQITGVEEGVTFKNSYIDIVKNRYDGDLGAMAVYFDKNTLCMSKPPMAAGVDESLKVSATVASENSATFNGGGNTSEDVADLEISPAWLQEWQKEQAKEL